MAKKTAPAPPPPRKPQRQVINLKGSDAYCDWLEDFHQQTHIPKAVLFRLGMVDLAAKHGFRPPPEQ